MARLNEPPPPVESIESLKRRFIRQNRELARKNSAQSIQIRNLEAEVSRLLCENLTIREESLQVKHELKKSHSRFALDNVTGIRGKLEEKLAEVGALMGELKIAESSQPPRATAQNHERRKSIKRSPTIRDFQNPVLFTEADLAEGRLPPILEDKSFPRTTLSADDIAYIIPQYENSSDSPELGPPPVAHFEGGDPVGDPVKREVASPQSSGNSPSRLFPDGAGAEDGDIGTKMFANLETRRRRRESGSAKGRNHPTPTDELQPTPKPENVEEPVKQPVKAGAKRKLSIRDDEDKPSDSKPVPREEFPFHRRSDSHKKNDKSASVRNSSQENKPGEKSRPRVTPALPSRKALGDKPVNTDPVVSPGKAKPKAGEKPLESKKPPPRTLKERNNGREKKVQARSITPIVPPEEPIAVSIEPADLPPITPAPLDLDLFSPNSSNPPTIGAESRDTPPPADLGPGASGRASRRRGNQVSYAEPNLRDKMRRPGKELVDAITNVKLVRTSSHRPSGGGMKPESDHKDQEIVIKKENDEEQLPWKSTMLRKEPSSPLGSKSGTAATLQRSLSAASLAERHRRISATSFASENKPEKTDASGTIAALVANGHKRMSRARESREVHTSRNGDEGAAVRPENLSVFDFTAESPERFMGQPQKLPKRFQSAPEINKGSKESKSSTGLATKKTNDFGNRQSRRRDTLATESASNIEELSGLEDEIGDGKGSLRAERAERRRSMMV